ncbi:MAG: LD-carboxypeptidase [Thermoanaerobaculia bacterium]
MIPVLPPAVRPGDRVGVAALSGPVDPERLARGMEELARLGFLPVPARNLAATSGLFAGDDRERAAAFHELADDPGISAIFFARGGHGLLRVLPLLDWDRLAARPRAYVGYSDLTPFLLNVVERLGRVAFHGPMVAAEMARGLSAEESRSLLDALAGEVRQELALTQVIAGFEPAEGRLLGGCLSLLASTIGTPFATPLANSVLLLEDVHEPLYRVDRMLTQLYLSGSLNSIRAMVLGTSIFPVLDEAAAARIRERTGETTLGLGLATGHTTPNFTLPLGCFARIDANRSLLVIDHPQV